VDKWANSVIASGAQMRAARGFLGWSQQDLAEAAGLHVNTIRYYEAQHGQQLDLVTATGHGANRITDALRRAGLELTFDPPAVAVNPGLYQPHKKPPIYKRWEKYRKPKQRDEIDAAELERIAEAWLHR
jgi:transcriptional regulator with XRE-family HTH domain